MKHCENCGKPESDQALVDAPTGINDQWCLDCMRSSGLCISCGKDIRLSVEDYFNYDDDRCPICVKTEDKTLNP